jgi:hypothetical protein
VHLTREKDFGEEGDDKQPLRRGVVLEADTGGGATWEEA